MLSLLLPSYLNILDVLNLGPGILGQVQSESS